MSLEQPTQEQIKEFWEGCGFKDIFEEDTGAHYWRAPNGDYGVDLPPIDINNLLKYAIPELEELGMSYREIFMLLIRWVTAFCGEEIDPTLVLFWVVDPILKGE